MTRSRLLSGARVTAFRSRDEQEVAGYAELMERIFESHDVISLTVNHIHQLHGILLKHSDKDQRHRGRYKKLPKHLEASDATGQSLGVVFETATPFDTPRLMDALLTSTNRALAENRHHPLVIVASIVVRFLAIHPYQDGNGRLSRAVITLLLLRAGYSYVPYSSLERIVEVSEDQYYATLRRAQATLGRDETRLIDWLTFFVRCLVRQKEVLERKVERERLLPPLAALSEQLMSIVAEQGESRCARLRC